MSIANMVAPRSGIPVTINGVTTTGPTSVSNRSSLSSSSPTSISSGIDLNLLNRFIGAEQNSAQAQMDYQTQANQKAMDFTAQQNELNR